VLHELDRQAGVVAIIAASQFHQRQALTEVIVALPRFQSPMPDRPASSVWV